MGIMLHLIENDFDVARHLPVKQFMENQSSKAKVLVDFFNFENSNVGEKFSESKITQHVSIVMSC